VKEPRAEARGVATEERSVLHVAIERASTAGL
jgi:hypothetical protein